VLTSIKDKYAITFNTWKDSTYGKISQNIKKRIYFTQANG